MLSSWYKVLSLAALTLHISRVKATFESIVEDGLHDFEDVVEHALTEALDNTDGVLAHWTLAYSTYAMEP
jgi:hypothetical protein